MTHRRQPWSTRPRRWRQRLAAPLAVLSALGLFAGCGVGEQQDPNAPATITFTWWGDNQRADLTNQAVELFERRNPTIQVETSFSAYGAYWDKLATQAAGGKAPDVMQMDTRYLAEYGGRGVLLDLGGDQAASDLDLSGLNPALVDTGKTGGKQYGIPFAQNAHALVYDPALFQAAGTTISATMTWADLAAAASRVSAANNLAVRGITDFGGSDHALEIWLRQRGKDLFTQEGKLGFGPAELTEYWTLTTGLAKSNAASTGEQIASMNGAPEQAPLGRKLSAAEFAYDSVFPGYQNATGHNLALAPYPTDNGQLGQYRRGSQLLSVSNRSTARHAAVKLVDFLINDPEAAKILGTNRGLPPNEKNRAELAAAATGTDRAIYDYEASIDAQLSAAPPTPPKGAGSIQLLLQRQYEEVAFGRSTVEQSVRTFFEQAGNSLG
ncbi:ABC transporter substrate-binding protein [Goodfellowiella coeruleoviolacea]|uniref:Multiple sugar transport system substrate-binding protein n=1 Tax=Goodfellowiella coeruleoviolacea TaxID=334858 RepID=A0AAE3G9W0_9PSEU|nr:extracellular solute-binding protein [Goodfellowiella coeruleoviolacea]MCP2164185.1 multiple sugar transport system substrate-binding protein [Goodfellowiella coeruleoviolacea]